MDSWDAFVHYMCQSVVVQKLSKNLIEMIGSLFDIEDLESIEGSKNHSQEKVIWSQKPWRYPSIDWVFVEKAIKCLV